jgi:hypothetical protein
MQFDPQTEPARQFHRHAARYEARLTPHADHAAQFRLSSPQAQTDMAVTDVSAGGLGLMCPVFLPKSLRVTLQVKGVGAGSKASDLELTIRAVVRSCTMMDHKPTYKIGLQFVDPTGRDERLLIQRATAPAAQEKRPQPAAKGGA